MVVCGAGAAGVVQVLPMWCSCCWCGAGVVACGADAAGMVQVLWCVVQVLLVWCRCCGMWCNCSHVAARSVVYECSFLSLLSGNQVHELSLIRMLRYFGTAGTLMKPFYRALAFPVS